MCKKLWFVCHYEKCSLTLHLKKGKITKNLRAVAQLVARLVRDQEVAGSTPACPIGLDMEFSCLLFFFL